MSTVDSPRTVPVGRAVLGKNQEWADWNRERFRARGLRVFNLLSSPGSGKTELLQRTLCRPELVGRAGVIVGDLATENDAKRLRLSGAPAVQINTGKVCHLDASMVAKACDEIGCDTLDLLFIENVGNLVCPASYDLGEGTRVVLLSVTEGEDKPLKYPSAFAFADVVIISKIDLSEAVGFDRDLALANIKAAAPSASILELSARSGMGMDAWVDFITKDMTKNRRE